jgi:polyisoprenoid-binding protein YceI
MTETPSAHESPSAPEAAAAPGAYRLDPERTVIRADVKAMFGLITVHGTFRLRSGEVLVGDAAAESTVRATIDAGSFSSGNATRDRDVVSPSLLDAAAYPDITFTGEGATQDGATWTVPGSVTAHGVTLPASLTMDDIRAAEGAVRFHATTRLDRTQFGVTKKKGMVGQAVALTIEAFAVPA